MKHPRRFSPGLTTGAGTGSCLGPPPKRSVNPNRFHFNFRWFRDVQNILDVNTKSSEASNIQLPLRSPTFEGFTSSAHFGFLQK